MERKGSRRDFGTHIKGVSGVKELKPCPFCGAKEINCDFVVLDVFAEWYVECEKCGAMLKDFSYKSDAVQAWNTRHEPPTPGGAIVPAGNERLRG